MALKPPPLKVDLPLRLVVVGAFLVVVIRETPVPLSLPILAGIAQITLYATFLFIHLPLKSVFDCSGLSKRLEDHLIQHPDLSVTPLHFDAKAKTFPAQWLWGSLVERTVLLHFASRQADAKTREINESLVEGFIPLLSGVVLAFVLAFFQPSFGQSPSPNLVLAARLFALFQLVVAVAPALWSYGVIWGKVVGARSIIRSAAGA